MTGPRFETKLLKSDTVVFGGTPENLKARLEAEVGWPEDLPLPAGARYAMIVGFEDTETEDMPTLVIEVLDGAMKLLEREVL